MTIPAQLAAPLGFLSALPKPDPAAAELRRVMHDPAVRAAGGRALVELRRLIGALNTSDLVLLAAGHGNAAAALDALATELRSEREAFEARRTSMREGLQEDARARFLFDAAAVELLTEAEAEASRHDALAREALRVASNLSQTLAGAGLSAEELAAIARLRAPAGLPEDLGQRLRAAGLADHELAMLTAARATAGKEVESVARHRTAAAAARAKSAALAGFLADPLRATAALPSDLQTALFAKRSAMLWLQQAGPTTTNFTPPKVTAADAAS